LSLEDVIGFCKSFGLTWPSVSKSCFVCGTDSYSFENDCTPAGLGAECSLLHEGGGELSGLPWKIFISLYLFIEMSVAADNIECQMINQK
jgi:hypothetical protein